MRIILSTKHFDNNCNNLNLNGNKYTNLNYIFHCENSLHRPTRLPRLHNIPTPILKQPQLDLTKNVNQGDKESENTCIPFNRFNKALIAV